MQHANDDSGLPQRLGTRQAKEDSFPLCGIERETLFVSPFEDFTYLSE